MAQMADPCDHVLDPDLHQSQCQSVCQWCGEYYNICTTISLGKQGVPLQRLLKRMHWAVDDDLEEIRHLRASGSCAATDLSSSLCVRLQVFQFALQLIVDLPIFR